MKYTGIFNYYSEITTLHRHANSEAQAFGFMCPQLAEKYGVTLGAIKNYFSGKSDNYRIFKA